MTTIRCIWVRAAAIFTMACAQWVVVVPAWAQETVTESAGKTSWVLPYALVVLGVGLGLVGVCKPGRRSAELRRRDME